jgi:hypothetical protein
MWPSDQLLINQMAACCDVASGLKTLSAIAMNKRLQGWFELEKIAYF